MSVSPDIHKNQQGITVVSLVLTVILVVAAVFAYRFVSKANQENKNQANVLENALGPSDQSESEDDGDYDIPDSPSGAQNYPIRTVNVETEVYYITLVAKLPGTFTGTCRAEVEQPNGDDYRRFVEPIENASSCRITVPRDKLKGSKTWQFQVSFVTSDGRSKGTHSPSKFSL